MSKFLKQAAHNEEFHLSICTQFSDDFFDWKITCIFYTALHYLKALASYRNVDLGQKHTDIFRSINPRNNLRVMQIPSNMFDKYDEMFRYSHSSRYDGISTDEDTFKIIMKNDYQEAVKLLTPFKKYILSQLAIP